MDNPIDVAARVAGSQKALASLLNVTPQAITKWRVRIPAERVLDIERVTGVPRCDLRPDLYPREPHPAEHRVSA